MVSVLIADDEAIERAVLKKTLLKNLGDRCRLFEAENGRQVLELYLLAWRSGVKTIYYVRSKSLEVEECESCSS